MNQTYATKCAAFLAPEQLPEKCHIKQARQKDLRKADFWQLGMTLFSLINPGLSAPFDTEFGRMIEYTRTSCLNAGNLPAMPD